MRKLNSMLISAQLKASTKASELKEKFTSKMNGDTQVVVALILIVVAVGLCVIFQDQIKGILATVSTRVSEAVENLANATIDQVPAE